MGVAMGLKIPFVGDGVAVWFDCVSLVEGVGDGTGDGVEVISGRGVGVNFGVTVQILISSPSS